MTPEIRKLEGYIMSCRWRDRNQEPMRSLTKEERIVYADYLDSIGQHKGAETYRKWVDQPKAEKKGKKTLKDEYAHIEPSEDDELMLYTLTCLGCKEHKTTKMDVSEDEAETIRKWFFARHKKCAKLMPKEVKK